MDPLSVTVAAIALIGAVSTSINLLQQLKNGPEGLSALLDDIAALRMLLIELEVLIKDPKGRKMIQSSTLPDLVLTARMSLAEIDEILNTRYLQRRSVESEPKARRMSGFRSPQRLKELKHTLLTVRINLAASLSAFIAYDYSDLAISLPFSGFRSDKIVHVLVLFLIDSQV